MTERTEADLAEEEAAAGDVAEAMGPGSRTLLGAALLGSSATILVGLLGVGRTKVLALELEPSGLGLYGQVLTLLTALSAASGLGLGLGTTRVVAECRAKKDSRGLKTALEVSFALPLAIAIVIALAIAASSGPLASLLLEEGRASLLVLGAVAVPLVALQGPIVHALQGFRDVAGAQGANVLFGFALTVASVAGVLVAGLGGAVIALAAGNLAYTAALTWRLRSLLRRVGVKIALRAGLRRDHLREPLVRTMLGIGFASLLVGVASTLADLGVRTVVLREEGTNAAGIFQALQLISLQLLGVIVTSIVFLSFTAITEAHAAGDTEGVRRSLDDTLRLALLLILPVVVALILFRTEFIRLFLSSSFDRGTELLPRQMAGDVLRTVAWTLGAALVPLGLTRAWMAITLLTVAGYVGAAAILVPAFGLEGSVSAYVAEWAVAAVLTVGLLWRRHLLEISGLTARAGLLAVVAVIGGLLAPEPSWPVASLVLLVFTMLLLMLGTAREERSSLIERARERLRASRQA